MLGELEHEGSFVVCDLEAGVGTLLRLEKDQVDVVLVLTEPSAKSLETARRALEIASPVSRAVVVANKVRGEEDLAAIRAVVGDRELLVVPDDPAVADADREGAAPIDVAPAAPAVQAIVALAGRLQTPSFV